MTICAPASTDHVADEPPHLAATDIPEEQFTTRLFRTVMGQFPTGVTIVTTSDDSGPHGTTVNSMTALSLEPALLLVCLAKNSHTAHVMTNVGHFAVNILSHAQEQLATWFASKHRNDAGNAFADVSYHRGVTRSPLIAGAVAHLDCLVHATVPAGDHVIVIGRVVALGADVASNPLIFHRGTFIRS